MPGNGAKEPEAEVPRNDGFHHITNVSRPTLTLFPAPRKAGATAAPAMIVCPGSGYSYPAIDAIGKKSCRPDFAVLVYPAYLDDKAGGVSPDLNLTAAIPPTLIVHNEDDKTHVVGSKIYDAALTAAKVAHEFAFYPTGGHGYGLHCQGEAHARPDDALKWMHAVLPTLGK